MTPKAQKMNTRMLSARLDELIEFGPFGDFLERNLVGLAKSGAEISPAVAAPRIGATAGVATGGPGTAYENVMDKFLAARKGAAPGVAAPRAGATASATGGPPGTDPLGRFIAARQGANPSIQAPVGGGSAGMATGAPAARQAAAPGATQANTAMQTADTAGQQAAAGPDAAAAAGAGANAANPQRSRLAKYGGALLGAGIGVGGAAYLQNRQQDLNALLTDLIEFDSASWARRLGKRLYGKNLADVKFKKGVEDIYQRNLAKVRAAKQQTRPSSPIAPSFHSGEYHDTPEWMNKDIKKSRREARGLSARLSDLINFADPRPRNPSTGEFAPQNSGGPDANAMATVYKLPQQGIGVGKAAGAAVAGGALGAIGSNIGKAGWEHAVKSIKNLAARRKIKP